MAHILSNGIYAACSSAYFPLVSHGILDAHCSAYDQLNILDAYSSAYFPFVSQQLNLLSISEPWHPRRLLTARRGSTKSPLDQRLPAALLHAVAVTGTCVMGRRC